MSDFVSLSDLIPILQLAVGPVILISGVGLILLSMTNRFGRVIDRSRLLSQALHAVAEAERASILKQLRILSKRARIIRTGIAFGVFSVLFVALLVISLFVGALFQLCIAPLIVLLFVLCLVCLIISLLLFLSDIDLSLKALWKEIPREAEIP